LRSAFHPFEVAGYEFTKPFARAIRCDSLGYVEDALALQDVANGRRFANSGLASFHACAERNLEDPDSVPFGKFGHRAASATLAAGVTSDVFRNI
jgi:hypothetical protein